ncbi:MAG: Flp pilus assembly complex ATPase component TadA [Candidatus Omnitrophica bacterium]|nr:Flp pilus assembly complex ATPase component TadA [Candidatus Omnitrophota bacterium]
MSDPRLKKLGEILLEDGVINQDQLEEALKLQQKSAVKKPLGETLIDLGYLSEESLALALSKKLGLRFLSLADGSLKIFYEHDLSKLVFRKFAEDNLVLPIEKTPEGLKIAMWDPLNFICIDNLKKMLRMNLILSVATKSDILDGLKLLYEKKIGGSPEHAEKRGHGATVTEEEVDKLKSDAADAPVVRIVNALIEKAVIDKVSDIHIDPGEEQVYLRYRVDGKLREMDPPDKSLIAGILSRIKILSKLDIAEKRLPQDGGFTMRINNRNIDFRVATVPTVYGEKVTIRILDKGNVKPTLELLGLEEYNLKKMKDCIFKPHGLIFVTGPTGSGKTTTLNCILNTIKSPEKNIMTIEDPVEYKIDGINQVQAESHIGLDFARGLKTFLRQDPDVMMVGEVRDLETAEICVRASLVGRLVLSTLHTNDSVSALVRLIDLGIEPFLIGATINMIIAQRLIRKLCPKCKVPASLTPETLRKFGLEGFHLYTHKGCPECGERGYAGRAAIYEMFTMDPVTREMVEKKADLGDIKRHVTSCGFKTLRDDGLEKVKKGITSLDEVLTITMEI